jgi:hypothetical protein
MIKALARFFKRIHEINMKYAKPGIQMTRLVAISLLVLRLYLIVLVALLVYKFILLVG